MYRLVDGFVTDVASTPVPTVLHIVTYIEIYMCVFVPCV